MVFVRGILFIFVGEFCEVVLDLAQVFSVDFVFVDFYIDFGVFLEFKF